MPLSQDSKPPEHAPLPHRNSLPRREFKDNLLRISRQWLHNVKPKCRTLPATEPCVTALVEHSWGHPWPVHRSGKVWERKGIASCWQWGPTFRKVWTRGLGGMRWADQQFWPQSYNLSHSGQKSSTQRLQCEGAGTQAAPRWALVWWLLCYPQRLTSIGFGLSIYPKWKEIYLSHCHTRLSMIFLISHNWVLTVFVAGWPWASCSVSLSFSFLICKMGVVPLLQSSWKGKWTKICEKYLIPSGN